MKTRKVSEKKLKRLFSKARNLFLDIDDEDTLDRVSHFYIIEDDYREVDCLGTACHSQIRRDNARGIKAIFDFIPVSKFDGDKKLISAHKKYADYIINRSPYRGAFYPVKGYNYHRYGVRGRVDISAQYLAAAMIALRHGSETPHSLPIYDCLVKNNIPEYAAFLICHGIKSNGKLGAYLSQTDYHTAFGIDISKENLTALKYGEIFLSLTKGKKPAEIYSDYHGISAAMYSGEEYLFWYVELQRIFYKVVGEPGENAFGVKNRKTANKKQLIEIANRFVNEFFGPL